MGTNGHDESADGTDPRKAAGPSGDGGTAPLAAPVTDDSDTVIGTAGDDVIDTSGGSNLPDDGFGASIPPDPTPFDDRDTVDAGAGNDHITTGDDTVYGVSVGTGTPDANDPEPDSGDLTISGGPGDDSIFGSPGDDIIFGGAGDDTILGDAGDDTIFGGSGDDTIDGGSGNDRLHGDAGDDTIFGGSGDDVIFGGSGDDTIDGGSGDDRLYGGDDDDTIFGGSGDDLVDGGVDDDFLDGGSGDDHVIGGQGDDWIIGGTGDDLLEGNDDADVFTGFTGRGDDTVSGGAGGNDDDTLDLRGSLAPGASFTISIDGPDSDGNGVDGSVSFFGADGRGTGTIAFTNIENIIPCFTPGTAIATPEGERAVETLREGERVITRDNGLQEIAWIGQRRLSAADLAQAPHLQPVLVRAGALGHGLPERDMRVSPQHRLLISDDRNLLWFEEREVLVAAYHLVGRPGIARARAGSVSYVHFMCASHEVVLSDGAWSESFQPGDMTLGAMGGAQRAEILKLFPALATAPPPHAYPAARRTLKRHEARLLARA